MSFDLYVWREPGFISADDGHAKLERANSEEFVAGASFAAFLGQARTNDAEFQPHESVAAFRIALLDRFPALESYGDNEIGVWAMTPKPSDRLVRIRIQWAHRHDVPPVVRETAREFGLVCYDPQSHAVWPNVPGYEPVVTLWSLEGLCVPDPDPERIERAVVHLTHPFTEHRPVVVQHQDGETVQVCYGEHGADVKTFELVRGNQNEQGSYSATTEDQGAAVAFMLHPLSGDRSWLEEHQWRFLPSTEGGSA